MKVSKHIIFAFAVFITATASALAQNKAVIKNPIVDFFHLNIDERFSDASVIPWLKKISCDFAGDGKEEFFLGTLEMWTGDNTTTYSVLYAPEGDKFRRLTPADLDIPLDTRFFGPRETTFCGFFKVKHTQGVLVLQNDNITRNPDDPGLPSIRPKKYSHRKFYHIVHGKLVVDDLGPLDLRTKSGKAFFNEYFSDRIKSRPIHIKQYSLDELTEMGYSIPSWKTPPESKSN